ncbi:MAG: nuclear transport factor 2 family protein [Solirubrobacterales bacterium]
MPSDNVETLRRGYEALNTGDLSGVRSLLHPEIEWQEGDGAPEAGIHQGREGFESFLSKWLESFDDFRIEPQEIIEQGDRLIVVVQQSGTGRASGIEVEAQIAHVWTVADGMAVRWQSYSSREEALGFQRDRSP